MKQMLRLLCNKCVWGINQCILFLVKTDSTEKVYVFCKLMDFDILHILYSRNLSFFDFFMKLFGLI